MCRGKDEEFKEYVGENVVDLWSIRRIEGVLKVGMQGAIDGEMWVIWKVKYECDEMEGKFVDIGDEG